MKPTLLIVVNSGIEKVPFHTSHIVEFQTIQSLERVQKKLRKSTDSGGVNGKDGIYYTTVRLDNEEGEDA